MKLSDWFKGITRTGCFIQYARVYINEAIWLVLKLHMSGFYYLICQSLHKWSNLIGLKESHVRMVLHSALKLTEPQNLLMKTYFRSCLLCQSTYMRMLRSINIYLSLRFFTSKKYCYSIKSCINKLQSYQQTVSETNILFDGNKNVFTHTKLFMIQNLWSG